MTDKYELLYPMGFCDRCGDLEDQNDLKCFDEFADWYNLVCAQCRAELTALLQCTDID